MRPKKIVDLLDGETFEVVGSSEVPVDVPLGQFRFIDIDIELAEPYFSE